MISQFNFTKFNILSEYAQSRLNSGFFKTEDDVKNMEKLIDFLEENEDVQNVWHNWEQD